MSRSQPSRSANVFSFGNSLRKIFGFRQTFSAVALLVSKTVWRHISAQPTFLGRQRTFYPAQNIGLRDRGEKDGSPICLPALEHRPTWRRSLGQEPPGKSGAHRATCGNRFLGVKQKGKRRWATGRSEFRLNVARRA